MMPEHFADGLSAVPIPSPPGGLLPIYSCP